MGPALSYFLWVAVTPGRISRTIRGGDWFEDQWWDPERRRWVWDSRIYEASSGMSSNDAWVDWISEERAVALQPGLDTSLCRVEATS